MGEVKVEPCARPDELRRFTQQVLRDLETLEDLLEGDLFESRLRRIGAEQELVLVDPEWQPAPAIERMLEELDDPHYTCEVARFNLEINVDPEILTGTCFTRFEQSLEWWIERAREAAERLGLSIVLTGILPTLKLSHLDLDNMTPEARYKTLNDATKRLRGNDYSVRIRGLDEITVEHSSVMLEACNTSFQVHYQVTPGEFAPSYNAAQAVAGPVLAAAANSPLLFGRRLWAETRIPLFQQSVDTRNAIHPVRRDMPRVAFGADWVKESVLEIYREDVGRFPALLACEISDATQNENPPPLEALKTFNSTVYRWNRPCYGISEGRPHLRIENRYLPAGPTVTDEVANAALWCGLVAGLEERHPRIDQEMPFERARDNFVRAAMSGLGAQLAWLDGEPMPAAELLLSVLMPIAHLGLERLGVEPSDRERFLGIVQERVSLKRTGARWIAESLDSIAPSQPGPRDLARLTEAIHDHQHGGEPIARWGPLKPRVTNSRRLSRLLVQDCMSASPLTVRGDQVIDLAASLMEWRQIRHVPVEDSDHRLLGLVTLRTLLAALAKHKESTETAVPVEEIMLRDVITIGPDSTMADAFDLMMENQIGCLPVLQDGVLVGILCERDFMSVADGD